VAVTEETSREPMLGALRRGVRLELWVAPLVVLLPLGTAAFLAGQGVARSEPRLVVLAGVLAAGNVVFDLPMIQAILAFLRDVRDAVAPEDTGDKV
jgi:hypothetical protein